MDEYVPDDQNLKEYFHLLDRVSEFDDLELVDEFVRNNSSKLAKVGSNLEFLVTIEMFKKKQNLEILHTRSHKFKRENSFLLQNSIIDFVKNYPKPKKSQEILPQAPLQKLSKPALISPRYKLNLLTKEAIRRELLRVIPIVCKTDVIPLLEKLLKVIFTRSEFPR